MPRFSYFLSLLLLAVLFTGCSSKPVRIEGTAMSPTLNDGDKALMEENIGEIKRGDIVSFLYPKDTSKMYIKRVVGVPGEVIEISDGIVYVNGQKLDEPYVVESNNKKKQYFAQRVVAENNYFVMGDNRDNSSDSRYWGTVSRDLIKGKYYMTYARGAEQK